MAKINPLDAVLESLGGSADAMSAQQRQLESGNRQLDVRGNPLVGKRKDGTAPPDAQKAYGISQIQLGTAEEVAKKHGIPFDKSGVLYNEAYNRRLGDLHMDDLVQRYGGDTTLAQAAYHSGAGTVDKALAKHGRENFTQGLGPEGRDYVAKLTGQSSMASAPLNLDPVAATIAELTNMGKPLATQVVDPKAMVPAVRNSAHANESAADAVVRAATEALNVTTPSTAAVRQNTEASGAVTAKIFDNLAQQDSAYTEQLQAKLTERRQLVARREELRKMNPFARLVKGITDRRYNRELLEVDIKNNDDDLAILNDDYKQLSNANVQSIVHQDSALEHLNQTEMADVRQAETNLAAATRMSAATSGHLAALIDTLGTNAHVSASQTTLENQVLSNTSEAALGVAAEEAARNGGVTTINGVELSQSKIDDARLGLRRARIASMQADLAAQAGSKELQDHAKQEAVDALTPAQAQQALAQGGVLGEAHLDPTLLAIRVERDSKVSAAAASARIIPDELAQYKKTAGDIAATVPGDTTRVTSLGGQHSPAFTRYLNEANQIQARHAKMLETVQATGADPSSLAPILNKEMDDLLARRTAAMTEIAKGWSGGNASLTRIGTSFLTGTPISPSDATQAMVLQARGTIRLGGDQSGAGLQLQNTVTQMVNKWDAGHRVRTPATEKAMIESINKDLTKRRAEFTVNNVFNSLPTLAKSVLIGGKPHPLSQIPDSEFAAAIQAADVQGLRIAQSENGGQATPQQIAATQTLAFFDVLDQHFSHNGFDASKAFADFVGRPEVVNAAAQMGSQRGSASNMKDFITSSALGVGGSSETQIRANAYHNGYIKWRSQKMTEAAAAGGVAIKPADLLTAAGSAIEGVTASELTPLAQVIAQSVPYRVPTSPGSPRAVAERYQIVGNFLRNSKFADNPALETTRKRVLAEWPMIEKYGLAPIQSQIARGND